MLLKIYFRYLISSFCTKVSPRTNKLELTKTKMAYFCDGTISNRIETKNRMSKLNCYVRSEMFLFFHLRALFFLLLSMHKSYLEEKLDALCSLP